MELKDIKIGTRFEIEILGDFAEKTSTTYVSQLLEHSKEHNMLISTPIHEARLVYIPADSHIRVYFLHPRHGFLSFTAKLAYKGTRGKVSVMGIKPDSGIESLQRRKNFRLECLLRMEYIQLDSTGKPSGDKWSKGVFKNISASGACMVVDEDIPKGTELKFRISLTDTLHISAVAVVLRNVPVDGNKKKHEHGLYFTEMNEKDQDRLVKYIFEQQRILLSRDVR